MNRKLLFLIVAFSIFLYPNPDRAQAQLSGAISAFQAALNVQQFTAVPSHTPSETIKDSVIRPIVASVAQAAIHQVVNSTISWINNGFDGNPAYVTNPGRYFGNLASGLIGEVINSSDLGFLCSPFQAKVKLALVSQYVNDETRFQCTLEDIGANIDGFRDSFDGGWDAWIEISKDQNNPRGAFLMAKAEIDSELARTIGLKEDEWRTNQGFLSWRECLKTNPEVPQSVIDALRDGWMTQAEVRSMYPDWDMSKPAGACIRESSIKTPGIVIADKLPDVLGVGLDKLVSAKDIDDLVNALLGQLLSNTVFGDEGIFDDEEVNIPPPPPPSSTTPGWTFCASEGGTCSFSGTKLVRYGTTGLYTSNTFTSGVSCSNSTFGDPAPGAAKRCEYLSTSGDPSDPSGGMLSCSPDRTVSSTNREAIWTIRSSYPDGTTYQWLGTDIEAGPTEVPVDLSITYTTGGEKEASISAYLADGSNVTVPCDGVMYVEGTSEI